MSLSVTVANRIRFAVLVSLCLSPLTAASRHMVLHEKFTNKGCGPCAQFAPASDAWLEEHVGEVVAITYHGNYPSPYDDFYLASKSVADSRISLYGVTGYPSVFLNGESVNANVAAIDNRFGRLIEEEQTVEIGLVSKVTDGVLDVSVDAVPLAGAVEGGNLRLFVAVVEETVIDPNPGTNRQTEFHHEFRRFLGGDGGIDASALASGESVSFSQKWTIEGLADPDELSLAAWVQDMTTGKVVECAYTPKESGLPEAAKVLKVEQEVEAACFPYWKGKVAFRNTGSNPIRNCEIVVNANGYVQKTAWEGDLGYLQQTEVELPVFTAFQFAGSVEETPISVCISAINGTDAMSDLHEVRMSAAPVATHGVQLAIFTDDNPQEITWSLLDDGGSEVAHGGPYSDRRKRIEENLDIKAGCYRLVFSDEGGNGIKGEYGNGYYTLYNYDDAGKRRMLVQGDYAGASHTVFFNLESDDYSSVAAAAAAAAFSFDAAERCVVLPESGHVSVADLSGRVIADFDAAAGRYALPARGGDTPAVVSFTALSGTTKTITVIL